MAKAVITNRIKKQVINNLLSDVNDSANNYYALIGRSEIWNDSDLTPDIYNSGREERNFRLATQSAKNITDITMTVPRYNWAFGAIYSAYDDSQVGYPSQPYYVMNDNNQVYLCIQQGKEGNGNAKTSQNQPTGNTTGTPFQTADGYIWKFLYSISALDATKFISANFIPVKLQGATDSDSQAADVEQLSAQGNAVIGEVIGFALDSGGSGYGSNPTVTIKGDGVGAKGTASVDGGQVKKVELVDSSGSFTMGSGYTRATIEFSGVSFTKPAKGRVILSKNQSPLGLGGDPRDDLRSSAIMFNSKPDGTESGDFIVDQDFRQVGLLKNPKVDSDTGTAFTASTGNGLKKLKFSASSTLFTKDNKIVGGTSQAVGIIDKVDSAAGVFYHQTEETGFTDFQNGEAVTETGGSGAATLHSSTLVDPEFNPFTGDLMYIANRDAITRDEGQTEDIKIIIQI
jgi:hypothetical protein